MLNLRDSSNITDVTTTKSEDVITSKLDDVINAKADDVINAKSDDVRVTKTSIGNEIINVKRVQGYNNSGKDGEAEPSTFKRAEKSSPLSCM